VGGCGVGNENEKDEKKKLDGNEKALRIVKKVIDDSTQDDEPFSQGVAFPGSMKPRIKIGKP